MPASPTRWLTHCFSLLALCAAAAAAMAQTTAPALRKADPLDAGASVPAVVHESVFRRERRDGDAQAVPWREANETVDRIGGWRAYAREAQRAEPAASAAAERPAAAPSPARPMPPTPGHGGHHKP